MKAKNMSDNINKQLADYPHQDPLGFEQILIIENYNRIFNNLLAAYGRLMYIKQFYPKSSVRQLIDTDYCVSRREEILIARDNSYHGSLSTMREISNLYKIELGWVEQLEKIVS
ncbi:hypothetical protein ACEN2P_19480 [Pedobacter psychrotolerans]|uniref:hypothetical protein n=1 Tax=Pedobacter psychrotolerans TaxID=1843235 RepID=UPI003F992676